MLEGHVAIPALRALGQLGQSGTWRALGHLGNQSTTALGHLRQSDTRMALVNSGTQGTWELRSSRHLGTWALRHLALGNSKDTWALGNLGTRGSRGTLFSKLTYKSWFQNIFSIFINSSAVKIVQYFRKCLITLPNNFYQFSIFKKNPIIVMVTVDLSYNH